MQELRERLARIYGVKAPEPEGEEPEGASDLRSRLEAIYSDQEPEEEPQGTLAGKVARQVAGGALEGLGAVSGQLGRLSERLGSALGMSPEASESRFFAPAGKALVEAAPPPEPGLLSEVSRGVGSSLGLLPGAVGGPLGIAATGVLATGYAEGEATRARAIASGASEEEAEERAWEASVRPWTIASGASEVVPLGRILFGVDRRTGGLLKRALRNVIRESVEEAGQESAQEFVSILNENLDEGERQTIREILAEHKGRLARSGLVGALAVTPLSLVASAVQRPLEGPKPSDTKSKSSDAGSKSAPAASEPTGTPPPILEQQEPQAPEGAPMGGSKPPPILQQGEGAASEPTAAPTVDEPRPLEAQGEQYPRAGETVDSRQVGGVISNTSSIASSFNDWDELPGVREVPMSDFKTSGKHYSVEGTKRIGELAEEIRQSGRVDPLIVAIDKDGPYILEGATRIEALHQLGAKSFPALVVVDRDAKTGIPRAEEAATAGVAPQGQEAPVVQDAAPSPPLEEAPEPRSVGEALDEEVGIAPVRVYHGTGAKFEEFSDKYIGSGEGAQSFGHGHYFTSKKEIAEHYRRAVSSAHTLSERDLRDYFKPGNVLESYSGHTDIVEEFVWNNGDWHVVVRDKNTGTRRAHSTSPETRTPRDIEKFKKVTGREPEMGETLEVELAPKADEFLLWDKPLSEQSEKVKKALQALGVEERSATGEGVVRDLAHSIQGETMSGAGPHMPISEAKVQASRRLREAGIRGIKYLDQGSRGAGEGTYNYVVFDPKDARIVRPKAAPPEVPGVSAESQVAEKITEEPQRAGPEPQAAPSPASRPSIDHTILSPSGRVSKRAREQAMKREAERLFPPGYWDAPKKTDAELRAEKAQALRRSAQNLRDLADRGMSPRKHLRAAERLEAEAAELEKPAGGEETVELASGLPSPLRTINKLLGGALSASERETDTDALARKFHDYFRPIRRAQETEAGMGELEGPSLAETTYHGRTTARVEDLRTKAKRVRKLTSQFGVDLLDDYLTALHTPERRALMVARGERKGADAPEFGSGMSEAEAAEVLARVESHPQSAKIKEAAGLVREVLDTALGEREGYGLLSAEGAKTWRELYGPNYVPLRDEPSLLGNEYGAGRGFKASGKESKRAKGRKSRAASPTAHSFAIAEQVVQRGEKNRVAQELADFVEANPNPDLWELVVPLAKGETAKQREEAGGPLHSPEQVPEEARFHQGSGALPGDTEKNVWPALLPYKVGGEQRFVWLKDPTMARAMHRITPGHGGLLLQVANTFTRFLRSMIVSYNPAFWARNMFRDAQTGAIHNLGEEGAKTAAQGLKRIAPAVRAIYRVRRDPDATGKLEDAYREFRLAGGEAGWSTESVTIAERVADLNRTLEQGHVRAWLQHIGDLFEDISSATENGARLSAYMAYRANGDSESVAAAKAKHVTVNFNRRGEWAQELNAAYLFYNAGLQGNLEMMRRIGRSPRMTKIVVGIAAAGFAEAWLNRIVGGEDDDGERYYDKIPPWVRNRNWILMFPDGSGRYLKVPLPWGYNIFHVLGVQMEAWAIGGQDPSESAGALGSAVIDFFNPLGASPTFLQLVLPTAFDFVAQVGENKEWHGGPMRPTNFDQRPESELYWPDASPAAIETARLLNELTGGSSERPGSVLGVDTSVSPETLEGLVKFLAGGVGTEATNLQKTLADAITEKPLDWNHVPIFRDYFGTEDPRYTERKYRENLKAVQLAAKERKKDPEHQKTPWLVKTADGTLLETISKATEKRVKALKESGKEEAAEAAMRAFNKKVRDALNKKGSSK